jgi:hypothetical protein
MTTFDWLAIIIGLAHGLHHIVSHFNIVQFSMYTYHVVRRMGKLTLLQLHIERVCGWFVSQWYYDLNQHPPVHHPLDACYDSVVDG